MAGIAYLLSIISANIIVSIFGLVTVLGITFPAGAPLIGMTFTFRDMVQRRYGPARCWWWMLAAMVTTVLFNPKLALASGAAFIVAEGVDWAIYTYTKVTFSKRVMLSNLVGLPLDSFVFVVVAFGFNWPAIIGQTLVKFMFCMVPIAVNLAYKLDTQGRLEGM